MLPRAISTCSTLGRAFRAAMAAPQPMGAGLVHPGRAMDLDGTSEVVAVSAAATTPIPGIISFPPFRGTHVHAGPTQAGGPATEWVAGLLSCSVA